MIKNTFTTTKAKTITNIMLVAKHECFPLNIKNRSTFKTPIHHHTGDASQFNKEKEIKGI